MATTIAFDLISALYDLFVAKAPEGVVVYDGPGFTGDPGNFLMVGVGDPDSTGPAEAATGTQEWAGLGANAAYEDGVIPCCALAWTGDVGDAAMRSTREAVRDMVNAIDLSLRADPNLGGVVPGLNWVRYGRNYRLPEIGARDGSAVTFYFEIAYKARLV